MKPQKQKYRHDPANGVWGDCARTALAVLLDLDRDDVPHFFDGGVTTKEADARREAFLSSLGLRSIGMPMNGSLKEVLQSIEHYNPGVQYILIGKSRAGCAHEVVVSEGNIAWDPSLDDNGIVGPDEESGFFWVTFIGVPLPHDGVAVVDAAIASAKAKLAARSTPGAQP